MRLDTKIVGDTFEFSLKAVEVWEKPPKPKKLEDEDEGQVYRLYSVHAPSSYRWLKNLSPTNDDAIEKAALVACEKVLIQHPKTQD